MQARILNQSKLVAALLALAAAIIIATLTDPRTGAIAEPSIAPAATQVVPTPSAASAAPTPSTRKAQPMTMKTRSSHSVIVQSGRSVRGHSVTAEGAAGESVKSTGKGAGSGTSAQGGAGGSASAKGGSATSSSVKIQTTGP